MVVGIIYLVAALAWTMGGTIWAMSGRKGLATAYGLLALANSFLSVAYLTEIF